MVDRAMDAEARVRFVVGSETVRRDLEPPTDHLVCRLNVDTEHQIVDDGRTTLIVYGRRTEHHHLVRLVLSVHSQPDIGRAALDADGVADLGVGTVFRLDHLTAEKPKMKNAIPQGNVVTLLRLDDRRLDGDCGVDLSGRCRKGALFTGISVFTFRHVRSPLVCGLVYYLTGSSIYQRYIFCQVIMDT